MHLVRSRVLALVKRGAFTAAITVAADFARRNPERAACYALLAQAEEVAGYTKAAIQSASHAIALAPQEHSYRLLRGRLYLKANRLAEAVDEVTLVIEAGTAQFRDAAIACRDEALGRMRRHGEAVRTGKAGTSRAAHP